MRRSFGRSSSLRLILGFAFAAAPASATEFPERLLNLSSRAQVGTAGDVLIAGFNIAEGSDKVILIRAVGPGLTPFGVPNAVADPRLQLFNSDGVQIAANEDWVAANATVFAAVGAFNLPPGSRDAAVVATLAPGTYTAHLLGAATGNGLIEIYDVSGAARLSNLSTRARVEADRTLVIAGLTVAPGAGTRRLLIRALGPTLQNYGVASPLANPALAVMNAANVQLATNDNWANGNDPTTMEAAFAAGGALPLTRTSLDSAVVLELSGGAYTVLVSGVGGSSGNALVEIYDLTPSIGSFVSVAATVPTTDSSSSSVPGVFTFTRAGALDKAVNLQLSIGGSAIAGTDYVPLPTTVTIPAGAASTTLKVTPYSNLQTSEQVKTITATVAPGAGYSPGGTPTATVSLFFTRGTLHVANLRPAGGTAASTAFGTATLQLAADGLSAVVNVGFSNLSSPQTLAYLRLGVPGEQSLDLERLPTGQITNYAWTLRAAGSLTVPQIAAAIREGRVFLTIETANNPTGEIAGSFIRSSGSETFAPPAPVAAAADLPADDRAAARFLTQATFGVRQADIDRVRAIGINAWINEQIAAPRSVHRTLTMSEFATNPNQGTANNTRPGTAHRESAWWRITLEGPDQLRQRVAFALSQLFVVSVDNATLNNWQEGVAHYYDHLATHAFGDFRELLEEVTLSPMMGIYLSHLRNARADPVAGSLPDENYAREIMQLFTIGLHELQPDGTLRLDPRGLPVPTYDNSTIGEMARVFTGWSFASAAPDNANNFRRGAANYIAPMSLFPAFNDPGAKTIVSGATLPAGQGGRAHLEATLDALFKHPNTGPFVARRLIQRLVTSNPSPAYVYRVAQKFADNGTGRRGDLGAVVRAILTDPEARSATVAVTPAFGKLREPILRLSALFRSFPLTPNATTTRWFVPNLDRDVAQAPLSASSVFNFFEPDYVKPGPLAAAGLYVPEFQILTDTTVITGTNLLYNNLFASPGGIQASTTPWLPLARQPDQLLARLNLLLTAGALSPPTLARLRAAYDALPASTSDTDRVRTMAYLVMMSPEAAIQR